MLILQFAISMILICITVVIHAVALDYLIGWLQRASNKARLLFKRHWKIPLLVVAVLGTFVAHIVQIWLWAGFYLYIDVVADFEEALYFSTSSFTTVGFGDIYLDKDWRLVSAFQSANGFILFGWSTAFIFEAMSKLYEDDSKIEG